MKEQNRTFPLWILRGFEWVFALFGVAVCLWVSIALASQQYNDLWPTPGLYFVEIILISLAVLASRLFDLMSAKVDSGLMSWIAGGLLLAFVILGGFSIGPYLFPAMLAFWLSATISDLHRWLSIPKHVALGLMAALIQGGIIGLLLLYTSSIRG